MSADNKVARIPRVNSVSRRPLILTFSMAAVVLALVAVVALGMLRVKARLPTLDEVKTLARLGQLEEAEALLDRYLRAHTGDEQAHLLMAEFATRPSAARPELALTHLRAVRPATNKLAARAKFFEGKANYQRQRFDLTETCWAQALELDASVPEAGWALVDLLDKESRREEAHRLGMRVHEVEPDPRDRVRILLEMCRIDTETPDPLMQVLLFEPLVKEHPEHLPLCLTLGQALIRVNRSDEGLKILGDALKRRPSSPEAWDAWFTGLFNASQVETLSAEFAKLPESLAGDARFAKHEAIIAQNRRDWPAAQAAYRRAFAFEPYNEGICYRFRFVLRQVGDSAEYDRVDRFYKNYKLAEAQMRRSYSGADQADGDPVPDAGGASDRRGVYYEVLEIKTLGLEPHPELYQRLASLRERMGRYDEARAWHRLVLRDSPGDPLSLAALERLR
jgi:tetratricopeptide (TPR) repeat protein